MSRLRRGFKAEASSYSREFRDEMGLCSHEPLCPWGLAEHLSIPCKALSNFIEDSPSIAYLKSKQGRKEFSGIATSKGLQRQIIYNDYQSRARQASNIAHEISHVVLMHQTLPLSSLRGGGHYDEKDEAEAKWMGPALLISDEAAMYIAERGGNILDVAGEYGVSVQVIRMRLNVSGTKQRLIRR